MVYYLYYWRKSKVHSREELEERLKNWPKDIREMIIRDVLKPKEKISLEELCKRMTERQFMMLFEFDDSWTIEEKLKYYHQHHDKK